MERRDETDEEAARGRPGADEDPARPPSVAGDVEDAVSPAAAGELTRWAPPGQEADAEAGEEGEDAG